MNLFTKWWLRNEVANVPQGNFIVAPSSGKILSIASVQSEGSITKTPWGMVCYSLPKGEYLLIRIFLSLFDGHFTKSPYAGVIQDIRHQSGTFLPAFTTRAFIENERQLFTLDTRLGKMFLMQIAGVLIRRTVATVHKNEKIKTGQNVGYILCGSQVALFIPRQHIKNIRVKVGEKVSAGETILCSIKK